MSEWVSEIDKRRKYVRGTYTHVVQETNVYNAFNSDKHLFRFDSMSPSTDKVTN